MTIEAVKPKNMHEADALNCIVGYRKQIDSQFKELLKLCKGDMNETTKRLMHIAQNESIDESLRREIIDQGRLYVQLFKSITEQQQQFERSKPLELVK